MKHVTMDFGAARARVPPQLIADAVKLASFCRRRIAAAQIGRRFRRMLAPRFEEPRGMEDGSQP